MLVVLGGAAPPDELLPPLLPPLLEEPPPGPGVGVGVGAYCFTRLPAKPEIIQVVPETVQVTPPAVSGQVSVWVQGEERLSGPRAPLAPDMEQSPLPYVLSMP